MRPLAIATVALLAALHGVTHAARPGDPDPTFGVGGTVRIPVRVGDANDILLLPDGSIVLGGTGDPEGDGVTKFVLTRLDAGGGIVPEFGSGGVVASRLPLADDATVRRLALDADGRIVAAGITTTLLATGDTSRLLIVARYFPDGILDREFGFDGFRNSVQARDVGGILVGEDRSIMFVGRDRELIGGSLVQGSGFQSFQFAERSDGADVVPHLGGIVMGGTLEGDFFLMRIVNGFELDLQFGDAGSVRTPIGTTIDRLRKLLVLPDGRIIAVGATRVSPGDTDIALVRYTADGALDPTFGNEGIVVTPLGTRLDEPLDGVLAPDGTMVLVGVTCSSPTPCGGFVARLLPDGRLDPDFGDGGVVFTPERVSAVAMPDDGHVLLTQREPDALVVSRLVVAVCGNGSVETGEACDDGNTAAGDCCSATCTLEPDESPCADDGSACTADVCRAGTCSHVVPVEAGCLAATASTLVPVSDDVAGDRLRWSWRSTTAVDGALFGDPTTTTDLTVCLVAGGGESERALLEITVPAAGTCGAVPCWKQTRRGFRFRDVTAAGDGAALLRLTTGANGSRIELRARNLSGVAGLAVPLRVRAVRHDASACFEANLGPAPGSALVQ